MKYNKLATIKSKLMVAVLIASFILNLQITSATSNIAQAATPLAAAYSFESVQIYGDNMLIIGKLSGKSEIIATYNASTDKTTVIDYGSDLSMGDINDEYVTYYSDPGKVYVYTLATKKKELISSSATFLSENRAQPQLADNKVYFTEVYDSYGIGYDLKTYNIDTKVKSKISTDMPWNQVMLSVSDSNDGTVVYLSRNNSRPNDFYEMTAGTNVNMTTTPNWTRHAFTDATSSQEIITLSGDKNYTTYTEKSKVYKPLLGTNVTEYNTVVFNNSTIYNSVPSSKHFTMPSGHKVIESDVFTFDESKTTGIDTSKFILAVGSYDEFSKEYTVWSVHNDKTKALNTSKEEIRNIKVDGYNIVWITKDDITGKDQIYLRTPNKLINVTNKM